MSLRLLNTLSGQKEDFKPISEPVVKMYNCGPTVYNFAHIGNLRSYVFADILRRVLEFHRYKVRQVINITDVGHLTGDNLGDADTGEDRMEKGAAREHKTAGEIANFYSKAFFDDLALLNIETKGTRFPKATDHIKEQIKLIEKLEKKGFTYKTSDGVYFDTSKFSSYGKLGSVNIIGLKEGVRVEINTEKKNPTDFALWKFSPRLRSGQAPRQQEWPSPWGIGFPGWHIECSAMSMKYLGEAFDIHTGGVDHIPVHHNNEIAQSEAVTGIKFANYWLHNAHVLVNNQKMAKSVGNVYYLKNIIEKSVSPIAYRYWLLGAHYRTQINFTWEALEDASNAYNRLVEHYAVLKGSWYGKIDCSYQDGFERAIDEDLNTPQALAVVWRLVKDDNLKPADKKKTLEKFDEVLGLNLKKEAQKLNKKDEEIKIPKEVSELVAARAAARAAKDFQKADDLRRQIEKRGFKILDTESGTKIILT